MSSVKVFIGGSRAVSRLIDALRERLNRIMAEQHQVLVGDANGADKAVQQYFADSQYPNVTVFCTGARCRNNVGAWTNVAIAPPAGVHSGFDFYAVKDREMATQATHGFMLWDGESRGTFANIRTLVRDGKSVVVYVSPSKSFVNVKSTADIDGLLAEATLSAAQEVRRHA